MISLFASPEARAIAQLIRERPNEWTTRDEYTLVHESGLEVWISNQAYGLAIFPQGFVARHELKLWRVTSWCLVGGTPSQWTVWCAVKRWLPMHRRSRGPDALSATRAAIAKAEGRAP